MDLTNVNAWEPVQSDVTSCPNCRSADQLVKVLAEFDVVHNPRYAQRGGSTYCSTFAWDATRALGAEIPHWWVGHELNANALFDWLETPGSLFGWEPCDASGASDFAGQGKPAVAVWKNPAGGSGHIAMIVPTPDGATGPFIT